MKKNNETTATETAAETSKSVAAVAKEPDKAGVKPAEKSAGFSVYIGPTIPGVIQSGRIFNSSKANALKELASIVEKRPLVASLLVDGKTLAVDRIKVKTPGNLLYVNYQRLATGENK